MDIKAQWIAVDWGTSHLRAWAMQGDRALAQACSDRGMSNLRRDAFEQALLDLAGGWLGPDPVDVVICGMAGSRQGWVEAPYSAVPAAAFSGRPVRAPSDDPRLRAFVIPGLKQDSPADVMRGEETQIAGFLARNKQWDGVICLPGTHTKWVQVSADEVVSFRTFMTGELFALLGQKSVLRHSIGSGWDDEAFADTLSETLSRPEQLAGRLFGLRAQDLLYAQDPDVARARLSGLLIGAELAATRPYWLGQQLAVVGEPGLAATYAQALRLQGAQVAEADATEMTLVGLSEARADLGDDE